MSEIVQLRKKWDVELKAYLKPITWCEKCGVGYPPPTVAHRCKRIDIKTRKEYFMAAKLCLKCHQGYDENTDGEGKGELDTHQIMFDEITELIEKRVWEDHIA